MPRISAMPALLIRMSIGPSSSSIVRTIVVTAALLDTSAASGHGSAADGGNLGGDGLGFGGAVAVVYGDVRPGFGQSRAMAAPIRGRHR